MVISPADLRAILSMARTWRPAPRQAVLGMGAVRPVGAGAPGDAASPVQDRVAAVWQQVFGLDDIPVDVDFGQLGGDSLIATQIVARLRDTFGLELSLREFVAEPTIAGNTKAILSRSGSPAEPDVVVLDALLHDIESMSDEEIGEELAREEWAEPGGGPPR